VGEPDESVDGCVQLLTCPICRESLAQVGGTLKCPRSHSFDLAREGYVNLLLPGRRRPEVLGDTRDMLRARRRFLDRGHYAPLSDAINECVGDYLVDAGPRGDGPQPPSRTKGSEAAPSRTKGSEAAPSRTKGSEAAPSRPLRFSSACIVDVGCGEGYYIGRLERYLDGRLRDRRGDDFRPLCCFGMDVSKEAARLAARRYQGVHFFVASTNRRMLFADRSVQVVLNVFAPRNPVEFGRIAARGGLLVVVIPQPGHLESLRSNLNLLGIEQDKRERVVEHMAAGEFRLAGEREVEIEMALDGDELVDLVRMTPNYWHLSPEDWDDIRATEGVRTRAGFTMLMFRA